MKANLRSSFKFTLTVAVLVLAVSAGGLIPKSAYAAPGDLFVSVNGNKLNGGGFIYQYAPDGTRTIFASGLSRPRGLLFDAMGNLYVATNQGISGVIQGTILKFAPGNTMPTTFATGFGADFFLEELVIDSAGNVFVAANNLNDPNNASTIFKITPGGTVCPFDLQSDCHYSDPSLGNCSLPGQARGLAFDNGGNLFASDEVNLKIYKFTPGGVRTDFAGPAGFSQTQNPSCLAFDNSGNLFVSTADDTTGTGAGAILEFAPNFAPNDMPTTFATGLTNSPRGLAFDGAGNLFLAESTAINSTGGDILRFTPEGVKTLFASGLGQPRANCGAQFLAFQPNTSAGSNVMVNIGTVGSAVVALTFPQITVAGMTTVMPIDSNLAGTLPSGYELTGSNLAFQITTTATYVTPPPIIIAFQVSSVDAATFSQLRVLHNEGGTLVDVTATNPPPDPATQTIYASVSSLSPFVIAKFTLKAQVQQPINADGTSVFNVKRGVVPVKFTLTQDGAATCALPPATISLIRTAGTVVGSIDQSTYLLPSDSGSNFRIDSTNCQYVYNLGTSSLGAGTYKVNISIGPIVVGSGTFGLQ